MRSCVAGAEQVLADEMGLGKTVQTAAFFAYLAAEHACRGPHLVVAPASTLRNWAAELQAWAPALRTVVYHGTQVRGSGSGGSCTRSLTHPVRARCVQRERFQLQCELRADRHGRSPFDVLVTTYSPFQRQDGYADRKFLRRVPFSYIVLDEAHCMRNPRSSRYQNLLKISAQHRLLLSGTPLQNNATELLALLSFTLPTLFDWSNGEVRCGAGPTQRAAHYRPPPPL